jgi:dTDP-4-amino-4,6-dideoxygalactose transaminase
MKSKLAIYGGEKVIDHNRPHYIWPALSEETTVEVLKQLKESISLYDRSGIIERLETRLSHYHQAKHALLTSSGTAALHSVFVAAGLQSGDEVICPAYTFFATITPLFFTGAIPVLADCREDGNIDPDDIERRITKNTRAIVVTHMWGLPCAMDRVVEIAQSHNLLLLEDASHAHGATYKGKKVGTFGHASAFSLQAQKTLTGGEGGFLLTDIDEMFYRALLLGHYNKRCKSEIPKVHPLYQYATTGMGLKLRIHPVAAAIANQQFDNLEKVLSARRNIARMMCVEFAKLPGIEVPSIPTSIEPSWYAFIMQYKAEELDGLPIHRFYEALLAEGCQELDRPGSTCPLNYHPLFQNPEMLFPHYRGRISYRKGDFPVAEKFHESTLKLPVWHNSNDEEIVRLYIKAFRKVIENYKELL